MPRSSAAIRERPCVRIAIECGCDLSPFGKSTEFSAVWCAAFDERDVIARRDCAKVHLQAACAGAVMVDAQPAETRGDSDGSDPVVVQCE